MKSITLNNDMISNDYFKDAYMLENLNLSELNNVLIKDRLMKIKSRSCSVVNVYDAEAEITADLAEALSILYKNNNMKMLIAQFADNVKVSEVYPLLLLVVDIDKLKLLKAKQEGSVIGDIL
mgnify:FL=1